MLSDKLRQRLQTPLDPASIMVYGWDKVLPNWNDLPRRYGVKAAVKHCADVPRRYHFNLPHLDDWFPSLASTVSIAVTDDLTGRTFERAIPEAYIFHLHWMSHEATLTRVGSKERNRAFYLQQVLDAFAKEIEDADELSDWRSAVLTPVLVRAYHSMNDFMPSPIEAYLKKLLLCRGKLTEQHWAIFYFQSDVIHPSNSSRWVSVKKTTPQDIKGMSSMLVLSDMGGK